MKSFIQRFSDKIIGVLNGFDRLVLRGTLRPIVYPRGMMGFLWHRQILLKDFGRYVEAVTKQLKEASCKAALARKRPIIYLRSCKTDKQALVQKVALNDGITSQYKSKRCAKRIQIAMNFSRFGSISFAET